MEDTSYSDGHYYARNGVFEIVAMDRGNLESIFLLKDGGEFYLLCKEGVKEGYAEKIDENMAKYYFNELPELHMTYVEAFCNDELLW